MHPQGQTIGKELFWGYFSFVSEENRLVSNPVKYTATGTLVAALGAHCHHPRYFGNLALIKLVARSLIYHGSLRLSHEPARENCVKVYSSLGLNF